MTPAEEIKSLGLPSTQYVADNSDTHRTVLERWHKNKYNRFISIVEGVKAIKDRESKSNDNI